MIQGVKMFPERELQDKSGRVLDEKRQEENLARKERRSPRTVERYIEGQPSLVNFLRQWLWWGWHQQQFFCPVESVLS
jgi:hypothetical protein